MISCAILERPGRWRWAGIVLGLVVALLPALLLIGMTEGPPGEGESDWLGVGYLSSLARSFAVSGAVLSVAMISGLPSGVLAGMHGFPLRRGFLALMLLPLLVPSFLGAIGLEMLRISIGLPVESVLSGYSGTVIVFGAAATPLVFFAALLAVKGITRSQVEAALLAGGEWRLFRLAMRRAAPSAFAAAVLAGALALSDAGPGQILGFSGAANQILVTFSAQYDFALAARQSLVLGCVVLLVTVPAALMLAPRIATGLLGRDVEGAPLRVGRPASRVAALLTIVLAMVAVSALMLGLIEPATRDFQFIRALAEARRTLWDTICYGAVAGLIAVLFGGFLALCAGRERRLRVVLLAGLVLVFSLPPSLGALGLVHLASSSPEFMDPLMRSRLTLAIWLALRLFPIATVILMRRMGTTSPNWAYAAALHGVRLPVYARRVLWPWLRPPVVVAGLLVSFLAVADISSTLLLHPPGEMSFPLAIFTVMANAPESLVASLCLLYFGGASGLLLVLTWLTRRKIAGT